MLEKVEIDANTYELDVLKNTDIEELILIASEWVKDRYTGEVVTSELDSIRQRMLTSLKTSDYRYFVIRVNKTVLGCCALREPEEKMKIFMRSPDTKTLELVNVFLNSKYRGKGLGRVLLSYAFKTAKELQFSEVIWNSGPRYKNTAWDFYTKLVGEPFSLAKEFYGKGGDAPVWRKVL